ncbi:S-layer homology domain-containing protein [Thermus sp.]|uniref:S-layer homology domain-containing protein n=2 Tax=Thermus sp. TaxID=275 RepID=UPI00342CD2C4
MKRFWLSLALGMGVAWANFSDLPQGPIALQVMEVVQLGWMQGYPDGTFRGQDPLNRYQLAAALGRVLKDLGVQASPVAFVDVPQGHWALEPLALAAAWGLVLGYPDGTFRGQEPLTRVALAAVLAKLLERLGVDKEAPLPWDLPPNHWGAAAVRRSLGAGLMDLNPDGSFGPGGVVNRYQMARALAALKPWVEAKRSAPALAEKQESLPKGKLAEPPKAETLEFSGRWVGMARGQAVLVGERVWLWSPAGAKEVGVAEGVEAAALPWVLRNGALEDGRQRYVPLGAGGGKEVLPGVLKRLKEGHLALDPSGNYLLLTSARPLCDCPSRVVRLVLLLTQPVGLYAEYAYLLDDPAAKVVGVAWPDPRNLVFLEASGDRARLYRVNLNAGEDFAFTAWDEGGLEERSPLPVRPVAKALLAELPLPQARGLAFEAPNRLLTLVDGKLQRIQLAEALW